MRYRGYIVLYWRVKSAAVCSPTGSLSQQCHKIDSSKSHWNSITYSSLGKYLLNENYSKKNSIGFLSPHRQRLITLAPRCKRVSMRQCAGPSTVILKSVLGLGHAAGIRVPQPACAASAVLWNRHGASAITSIITATHHRAPVTRKTRVEGTYRGDMRSSSSVGTPADWERVRGS